MPAGCGEEVTLKERRRSPVSRTLELLAQAALAHLFDPTGEGGGTPMKRRQVVAKETTYETGQCLALAARPATTRLRLSLGKQGQT